MSTIPPVFVEQEDSALALENTDFVLHPAEDVRVGDYLWLRRQAYRVKSAGTMSSDARKMQFVLWPMRAGQPIVETYFNRQWIAWYREAKP